MSLGSRRRNLSFDILSTVGPFDDDGDAAKGRRTLRRSNSDPVPENGAVLPDDKSSRRKRKHKSSKRKKSMIPTNSASSINPIAEEDKLLSDNIASDEKFREMELRCDYSIGETSVVCDEVIAPEESAATVCEISYELRRRSVNGRAVGASEESASALRVEESEKEEVISRRNQRNEPNGKLENAESLDWERLMVEDPNYIFPIMLQMSKAFFDSLIPVFGLRSFIFPTDPLLMGKSSVKHFMEQMYRGNSLRSTITIGTEEERKRVYDTIFRLPWRCELLIDVGFFVCLNSFLSLLTIMPIRNLMALWKVLTRQFNRPPTTELSDFGCLIVLACGVMLLGQTDISLIYHMIRGQGTIKLYVVYNVLEIFDKLWQSFGGDVLETLFYSADGLANCSHESFRYWVRRYIIDLMLAAASSIVHSFILLAQSITLSTCIVAHNNALMALLVSNNFAEIKSNVFKRFSKDNVHNIVYSDSVERFHISAFLLFVLAQYLLEAEGRWFGNFLFNAILVYLCEMMIDIIKHSFIAKFNGIKPIAYSDFLEDLCKQTLNIQAEGGKKNLTFVPLAPACVVIRVLTPVYAAHLPGSPLPWRLLWAIVLAVLTFVMLASLKVLIGMGLEKHAAWYIKRCRKRKLHSD